MIISLKHDVKVTEYLPSVWTLFSSVYFFSKFEARRHKLIVLSLVNNIPNSLLYLSSIQYGS
jgi:hypothetical protein